MLAVLIFSDGRSSFWSFVVWMLIITVQPAEAMRSPSSKVCVLGGRPLKVLCLLLSSTLEISEHSEKLLMTNAGFCSCYFRGFKK